MRSLNSCRKVLVKNSVFSVVGLRSYSSLLLFSTKAPNFLVFITLLQSTRSSSVWPSMITIMTAPD